jgi:hypothetical protein
MRCVAADWLVAIATRETSGAPSKTEFLRSHRVVRHRMPGTSLAVVSRASVVRGSPRGNLSGHVSHMSAREATGFAAVRREARQ